MSQTLESSLFDFYINYPTLKCPIVVAKHPEQVATQPLSKIHDYMSDPCISLKEPQYSIFAWEPLLAFLAVFGPLLLTVLLNADKIIYLVVTLMGQIIRLQ